ncbi:MAG: ATP-binding protein [Erythrobacter sp.]
MSDPKQPKQSAGPKNTDADPFLELILENIPDMVFVKDEQFRIVRANANFLRVYPDDMRDTIIGTTTLEQYNEEERDAFLEQDKIAFADGFSETEESIDFPDGARRTLLTKKIRFEDADANKFTLGIGQDITELVRVRTEHEDALSLLENVFNTVTGAVIGLSATKEVLMINNAGRHMLAGEMAKAPFAWPDETVFLDPEDMHPLEASHDPISRALVGQKIAGEVHLMTRRSSSDNRYVRVSSTLVQSKSSPLKTVIVLDDVSESERNRQQIERQSRLDALGQLTGGIAHDFNNLLNTLQFSVELMRRDDLSERGQRSADAAPKSIQRGSELTNRLLAFAKKQPTRAAARPLKEIFAEAKNLVAPAIEASLTVKFAPTEQDLLVFCDQGQLQNAILNLILNSRDAIVQNNKGNQITVAVRAIDTLPAFAQNAEGHEQVFSAEGLIMQRNDDQSRDDGNAQRYVEISVSDNGPGMSKAVASRALDPFFTTKDVNSGTGLGLSMVYGFVQQSSGELRIYTEEGEGTTVKLFLPRGDEDAGLEAPVASAPLARGNGETILIVEDEDILLEQLHEFLKELGYKTLQASTGRAAMDMIEAGARADLVLTDIVMPGGIGGFELARLAREAMPDVPVIYMSGYTGFSDEEMGEVIAPLLPKPSSPSATSAQIRTVLDNAAEASLSGDV